jgi:ketopantoate reductase
MRTLVVGAGAIGGYFGGRLLEANQDVTFLVRPRRAAELAGLGLTIRKRSRDILTATHSILTASMLRDMERNAPIEADHIIGDMVRRGSRDRLSQNDLSFLRIAYTHLKAYETRRARMLSGA